MSAAEQVSGIELDYARACSQASDINEHLPTLRRYAEQASHVTEFGVRTGVSTIALMAGRPGRLVSYDFRPSEPADILFRRERESGLDCTYIHDDVLNVEMEATDLLFIDTWHSYNQLSRELALHSSRVARWIVLHDTETFGFEGELAYQKIPSGGLWAALGEFLLKNREWRVCEHFTNNNGLTVLEREENDPRPTWKTSRNL